MTMTLVSTVTVGAGGAASIDFTSIPQIGTDLLVVASLRGASAGSVGFVYIRFNGDTTATNYKQLGLRGSGSAASSYSYSQPPNFRLQYATTTASTFGNSQAYIPNYTSAVAKSISTDSVTENNAAAADQLLEAGYWAGTSAINRITLTADTGNFDQYSTASLYTITKGSGGATVS